MRTSSSGCSGILGTVSTLDGVCRLELLFPSSRRVALDLRFSLAGTVPAALGQVSSSFPLFLGVLRGWFVDSSWFVAGFVEWEVGVLGAGCTEAHGECTDFIFLSDGFPIPSKVRL